MFRSILLIAVLCTLSLEASAVVIWDEGVNGDLSNNPFAPTPLVFGIGDNTIIGSIGGLISQGGDQFDRITFSIGAGLVWTAVVVNNYVPSGGNNASGFEGYTGSVIDFDDSLMTSLGGTVPIDVSLIGMDILGFIGGPYGPGVYSVELRENQPGTLYSLSFQISAVPEPGTLALLGIGLFGMEMSRRKKV